MTTKTYDDLCALIDGEGDNALEYCFDEAWFAQTHPDEYEILLESDTETGESERFLQIACKAIEEGAEYGSAEGSIQHEMYEALFAKADSSSRIRELLKSDDRMTNLYFVLKMAVAFLNPKTLGKSHKSIGLDTHFDQIGPREIVNGCLVCVYRKSQCFTKLLNAYKDAFKDASASIGYDAPVFGELREQINRFAKRSSWLGNYTRLPVAIGDERDLNQRKGNTLSRLYCSDGTVANDQFSLFALWVKENVSKKDQRFITNWKKAMILNGEIWRQYKKAAAVYKKCILADAPIERLISFSEYLGIINEAIRVRSDLIVERLQSQ